MMRVWLAVGLLLFSAHPTFAAFQFVARADYDNSSSTTATISVPTGTADGDVMFAFLRRSANTDPSTPASGWTLVQSSAISGAGGYWLYRRIASSEPASYDWVWAAAARNGGTIVTYRDGIDTSGNPVDASNNTQYTTNDTTIRAGGITVTAANSPMLYFAGTTFSASQTLGSPSVPASGITWTEDVADVWNTGSRFLRSIYSGVWTGSGVTGTSDVTISASAIDKQGFLVALVPASAGGQTFYNRRRELP